MLNLKEIMPNFKSKRLMISLMAISAVMLLLVFAYLKNTPQIIDMTRYENILEAGIVKKAKIEQDEVILYTPHALYSIPKDAIDIKELFKKVPVEIKKRNSIYDELILPLILLSLLVVLFLYLKRYKKEKKEKNERQDTAALSLDTLGSFSITPALSNVKFKDVAGIKGVKEELEEIVDFLKNPQKYQSFGITMPKGVLLIGPPGVGKTLIAKAVAGEADVPFFYQSGASFVQIYVGMGAKRVRELFAKAKAYAPSIIFIDEIDAVGKARGGMRNDERESTLNQLLTEMDGFEDNSGVIVIGATNKIEVIDEALLRSGRFDRRVFIPLPDKEDRIEILKIYLQGKPTLVDIEKVATMSVGFSGAALSTLVNEAAINALRRGSRVIEYDDFQAVKSKVLLGKRRVLSFSEDEKRIQATYQAAKALSAYWFEVDFEKITIVNDRLKDIDKEIESKTSMLAKIKVYLSGMVATKLKYNEKFSNSTEDLQRAREIAKIMVENYGMGEYLLPSENDISKILNEALEEVEKFLLGMGDTLERVAKRLYEKESISKEELKKMLDEVF